MDPCPGGRFTVLRPSMRPSPFDTPFSKLSLSLSLPLDFFSSVPSESYRSIGRTAVPSGIRCVYIGAELARHSCLFRDIMATPRKWKRSSRSAPFSTRRISARDAEGRDDKEGRRGRGDLGRAPSPPGGLPRLSKSL